MYLYSLDVICGLNLINVSMIQYLIQYQKPDCRIWTDYKHNRLAVYSKNGYTDK